MILKNYMMILISLSIFGCNAHSPKQCAKTCSAKLVDRSETVQCYVDCCPGTQPQTEEEYQKFVNETIKCINYAKEIHL